MSRDDGPGSGDRVPAWLGLGAAPYDDLIIEGDNFEALKLLAMAHAGRVRCIYVDPPYDTASPMK